MCTFTDSVYLLAYLLTYLLKILALASRRVDENESTFAMEISIGGACTCIILTLKPAGRQATVPQGIAERLDTELGYGVRSECAERQAPDQAGRVDDASA